MKKIYLTLLSCCFFTFNLSAQVYQLPYFDDFESGAPGWVSENKGHSGTRWELGEPTTGFISSAYSGSNCWDLNLNADYTDNSVCHLISPVFDFTFGNDAVVSFYTKYQTEYLWDYLTVQYTINNGDTWIFLPFQGLENPAGYVTNWISSSVSVGDLVGYPQVQFRFTFTSDDTFTFDGYAIDNFRIETEPLGIENPDGESLFSVYPNPASDKVYINFSDVNSSDAMLRIADISGKCINTYNLAELNNHTLDVAQLQQGVYFLEYKSASGKEVTKLVIDK